MTWVTREGGEPTDASASPYSQFSQGLRLGAGPQQQEMSGSWQVRTQLVIWRSMCFPRDVYLHRWDPVPALAHCHSLALPRSLEDDLAVRWIG